MPGFLTLLLFIATLVVFHGGSWVLLQLVRESKEADFEKRLLSVGTTAGVVIGMQDYRLPEAALIEEYQDYPAYQDLQQLLRKIRTINSLRGAMVLDTEGQVLVDARRRLDIGSPHPFIEIDQDELQQAAGGSPAVTPYYSMGNVPHKRAYIPVNAPDGTLLYVLRLEAGVDYFEELDVLKQHLYWIGGIGTLLLGIIALIFYRLLSRLIRAEEMVAKTERFQALGTMASAVAHEVRNPLGIIRASAEEIKEEAENDDPVSLSLLDDIIIECDRINREIYNFLKWGSSSDAGEEEGKGISEISLNATLRELVRSFETMALRRNVSVELSLPEDEVTITIDPIPFRQALFNLILNSLEACGNEDMIRVALIAQSAKTELVRLEISDTGMGMTRRQLKRAFDPFYTTKRHGTGLGLSIARRIIEQSGGTLSVDSKPGKGTRITIMIPVTT